MVTDHTQRDDPEIPATGREFKIIVNAREKVVESDGVTFDQIIKLAFDPPPSGVDIKFAVTYRNAAGSRPDGRLTEGRSVKVKDGTVFNVTATDKS